MSARAEELAAQYDRAVEDLLATVGDLPDEVWTSICPDLGWTVAAATRHIGAFMADDLRWLEEAARGEKTAAESVAELHRDNAESALAHAHADHGDTLAMVEFAHQHGRTMLAALTDEQLAHVIPMSMFFPGDVSTDPWVTGIIEETGESARLDGLIEHILIGHVEQHLESIKAAVNAAAQTYGQSGMNEGTTD